MNKRSHYSLCLHKLNNSPLHMALFQSDKREIIESERERERCGPHEALQVAVLLFLFLLSKGVGENLFLMNVLERN